MAHSHILGQVTKWAVSSSEASVAQVYRMSIGYFVYQMLRCGI